MMKRKETNMSTIYPFTALVGQDQMKLALLLNAVDPRVGGVLIQGDKGTAKSTAVRGLAKVLPMHRDGTPMKVVDLPLHCTEDRLVGTLDIERMLQEGKQEFSPGILFEAHENILYVDEVNLLEDYLVDTLLDVAAMGVNRVEREGISHSHPSRFILVGTMNPEEGAIRPQLLDRFGLSVTVKAETDVALRMEVLRRRLAFEDTPQAFIESYRKDDEALRKTIETARKALPTIGVDANLLELIANISITLGVEGHRSDITLLNSIRALAALQGEPHVTMDHLKQLTPLVVSHRMKRKPFEQREFDETMLDNLWATYEGVHK